MAQAHTDRVEHLTAELIAAIESASYPQAKHALTRALGALIGSNAENDADRDAALSIALARKRGVYTGRKPGTTKAQPSRARALKKQGLTIAEIAKALGVKERTVYHYLSRSR